MQDTLWCLQHLTIHFGRVLRERVQRKEVDVSTLYSIGLMNQLGDAFEKAGFTSDDVTALRSFGNLTAVRNLVRGQARIEQLSAVIDCDAEPFIPAGRQIEEHRKLGRIEWNVQRVQLYLSKNQQKGIPIPGPDLYRELGSRTVLNAVVLDYLLGNPELIPEKWKGKAVFFWGTLYRRADGLTEVRCLCWNGHRWDWGYYPLNHEWDFSNPAAVLTGDK